MNILCWDRVGVGGGGSFQMMGETKFNSTRLGKLPELSRILKMSLNKIKKGGWGGVWRLGRTAMKIREGHCLPDKNLAC